jgi:hypothetical protein
VTQRRPWACREGDWLAALGPEIAVLLPPQERDRAAAVWALVDAGAGLDEVLDALLRDGLSGLSGFVLVTRTGGAGGTTRVLVRGPAAVRLAGPEGESVVTADPARTWTEESRDGVAAVSVSLPPAEAGAPAAGDGDALLSVTRGLLRVGAVELAADPPDPPGPADEPVSPLPEPPEEPERTARRPYDDGFDGPYTEAMPALSGSLDADHAPGNAPDPGPLVGPPTEAWVLDDADRLTELGEEADAPDLDVASGPGGPGGPGGPAAGRPVARLLFSSGDVADVDRVVLVGRAPDRDRVRSGDGPGAEPLLVAVPSPRQEISSTHLEVRPGAGPDLGLAVVTDLGSTNGTLLTQPGLPPEDLKAGVGVQLVPGAVLDLGDGLTIRVVDA